MPNREHLSRLPREFYLGNAIVHWTLTIRDRKQGWLTPVFFYRFRELLTHSMFRYSIACPVFCLMPDHIHMIWMGLADGSDQLNCMKYFRGRCDESLNRIGFSLQDQSYDHVLTEEERREEAFEKICEYIARNPERADLVQFNGYREYRYTSCLIPGYPELRPFDTNFRDSLDKIIAHLRKHGVQQLHG
ncbi:hypothetical protein SH449x_003457 [Pirellulaceae bacterium SH449]